MHDLRYIKPKKSEIFPISIVTFVLSLMFSIFILKFSSQNDLTQVFIPIFLFLNFLFYTKLTIMKISGLKNGIELTFDLTYLNQYSFRPFDKISNKYSDLPSKGLSSIIISILIYILTLGFVIFPAIWKINYNKINHKYRGVGDHHELGFAYTRLYEVTDHRIAKTYIVGFFYYFLFAQLTEIFFSNSELYIWLQAIVFYLAFFTLIPIPGSEGFELYKRNQFGYMMLIPILFVGMLSILVFKSVLFTSLIVLLTFGYLYFDKLWKSLTGSGGH